MAMGLGPGAEQGCAWCCSSPRGQRHLLRDSCRSLLVIQPLSKTHSALAHGQFIYQKEKSQNLTQKCLKNPIFRGFP